MCRNRAAAARLLSEEFDQFFPPQTKHRGCDTVSKALTHSKRLVARLKRLLKKSEPQIPRRLKSPRDDKSKGVNGTTEVVPLIQSTAKESFSPHRG